MLGGVGYLRSWDFFRLEFLVLPVYTACVYCIFLFAVIFLAIGGPLLVVAKRYFSLSRSAERHELVLAVNVRKLSIKIPAEL